MDFCFVLKELRIENGFSQKKLGAMLNTIDTTVTNWEKGRAEPNINTLKKLASIFNVSLDYLCGRTDKPELIEPYVPIMLKKEESEFIQSLGKLTKANKLILLGFTKGLIESQNND